MPLVETPLDSVCIVMLGAVGDVVHTLPVVSAIKRHQPQGKITWILQPGPASLVRGHPDVDEIIVFRRSTGLRAYRELRSAFAGRSFDITLAMQSYFKAGLITAMTPARIKLGFDKTRARDMTWVFNTVSLPPREERHFQDQYLEFPEAIGVKAEPLEWNLGPWRNEAEWRDRFAGQLPGPVVSIVSGASRTEREWFDDRWAIVCRRVHEEYGLTPVLIGGKSEREAQSLEFLRRESGVPIISTLGEPFRNLVSILQLSDLVISVNTGPMHMAVALNRPTISLHGFGNPKRVGPYRKFHDLMIDEYGDPGENYPITPKNRPGRMERITVEAVMDKVRLWRERYRS